MDKKITLFVIFALFYCSAAWAQTQDKDFYDTNTLRDLKVTFQQKNWTDLLDSMKVYGNGMLIANLTIDGKKFDNVGVRYRGGKSFQYGEKRNPYYIKLNYINKTQNFQGYTAISLSTALRDPSMVREVLGFEIARKYMNAPKANYARLYVNDQYRGLFVNIEPVEDKFLTDNFGSPDNTFFKCSPDSKNFNDGEGCKKNTYSSLEYEDSPACYLNKYELESKQGWDDLMELVTALNKDQDKLDRVLNVDAALWMLAYNNVLVNLSSYTGQHSQNYYLYKNQFGQFTPILWDLNLNFGGFKNIGSGSDLALTELQQLDPLLHAENPTKPLISQLLKNPNYQRIYVAHVRTLVNEIFDNGWYEKRAKELQELVYVAFLNDTFKSYSSDDFKNSLNATIGEKSKIPGIVELMSKRAKFLKKHVTLQTLPAEIAESKVLTREKFGSKNPTTFRIQAKIEKFPKRVYLYYRATKDKPFTAILMADDGKSDDNQVGDKVFGATIDPQGAFESIEYYFVVENVQTTSFYPSNYMFQPLKSSLSMLK